VRKINIETDIRLAMTAAIRRYLPENPDKFNPRDYFKPAREAATGICRQRYLEFGCEGRAGRVVPAGLEAMAGGHGCSKRAQVVHSCQRRRAMKTSTKNVFHATHDGAGRSRTSQSHRFLAFSVSNSIVRGDDLVQPDFKSSWVGAGTSTKTGSRSVCM
jgi:Fructose-bisphosphate aldolase class-II